MKENKTARVMNNGKYEWTDRRMSEYMDEQVYWFIAGWMYE